MNSKTLEHMQYFVGKVCSILTTPVNRQFDEMHARQHFVIRVGEITTDGIWGSHPGSGMVSYFLSEHIIGIAEEIELDPKNPEHAQMLLEYEKQTGKKAQSDIKPLNMQKQTAPKPNDQVPFVDIKNLEKLAAQTKSQYDFKQR